MKRENYLSWDEYFMGIALLAAKRSKDPGTQVGACIVSPRNVFRKYWRTTRCSQNRQCWWGTQKQTL